MKKFVLTGALSLLTPSLAFADVSNQVDILLGHDSAYKVTSETVVKATSATTSTDLSGDIDSTSTFLGAAYSYFLSPLKNDGKPVELREFYQHPSQFGAGLVVMGASYDNKKAAYESDVLYTTLLLHGEYYLPSNTGFDLSVFYAPGAGTIKDSGTESDVDGNVTQFDLAVRQYVARNAALKLGTSRSKVTWDYTGGIQGSYESTTDLILLGGQAVFADVVSLALEIGQGEEEDTDTTGSNDKYDIDTRKLEATFFFGKNFSLLTGVDFTDSLQTAGLSAGNRYESNERVVTIAPKYWFSERAGVELSLYETKDESNSETSSMSGTYTTKSRGVDINVQVRF